MSFEDVYYSQINDEDELPSIGDICSGSTISVRELEAAKILINHVGPLAANPLSQQWSDSPAATLLLQGPPGSGKQRLVRAVMHAMRLRIRAVPAMLFESASDVRCLMHAKERGRGVFLITRIDDILGSVQAERRLATFLRATSASDASSHWTPCLEPWICIGTTQLDAVEEIVGDETDRNLAVTRGSHSDLVRLGLSRDLAAAWQRVIRLAAPRQEELERVFDVDCVDSMEEVRPLQDLRGRIMRYGIDEVEIDSAGRKRLFDLAVHFGAGFHGVRAAVAQLADMLDHDELLRAYKTGKNALSIGANRFSFTMTFESTQGE